MNWFFWKKGNPTKALASPKDIPQAVGTYLVTKKGMEPDLV